VTRLEVFTRRAPCETKPASDAIRQQFVFLAELDRLKTVMRQTPLLEDAIRRYEPIISPGLACVVTRGAAAPGRSL